VLRRVTVCHRHRDRTRCLLSTPLLSPLLSSPLLSSPLSSLALDGVVNLGWSRGDALREVRGLRSLYAGTARNRCDSCGSETEGATAPQRPAPSDTERPHHRHRVSVSACAHAPRHQPSAFPTSGTDRATPRSRSGDPREGTPPRGGRGHYGVNRRGPLRGSRAGMSIAGIYRASGIATRERHAALPALLLSLLACVHRITRVYVVGLRL